MSKPEYTLELVAEDIGRIADEIDNVRAAGKLSVSDGLKLEMAHSYMEQWVAILRKMYIGLTNDNPWDETK